MRPHHGQREGQRGVEVKVFQNWTCSWGDNASTCRHAQDPQRQLRLREALHTISRATAGLVLIAEHRNKNILTLFEPCPKENILIPSGGHGSFELNMIQPCQHVGGSSFIGKVIEALTPSSSKPATVIIDVLGYDGWPGVFALQEIAAGYLKNNLADFCWLIHLS